MTERTLLGFFALYFAVLIAGAASRIRPWQLVSLSLGGAVLLGVVLGFLPAERSTQFWVEQTARGSGEAVRTARFASLIRVASSGPTGIVLPIPRPLGLPSPVLGTRPVWFEVQPSWEGEDGGAELEVRLQGGLLAANTLRTEGSLDWTSSLTLAGDAKAPRVENRGSQLSARATLLWNSEAFAIPTVAPGESFSPALAGSEPIAGAELPRWLAHRRRPATGPLLVVSGVPAALMPYRAATERAQGQWSASVGWTTILWAEP